MAEQDECDVCFENYPLFAEYQCGHAMCMRCHIQHRHVRANTHCHICRADITHVEHLAAHLIVVKIWTGCKPVPTYVISVDVAHTPVHEIKYAINDLSGIPPIRMRLVCCGRGLHNEKTLKDHGIAQGSALYVLMALYGD